MGPASVPVGAKQDLSRVSGGTGQLELGLGWGRVLLGSREPPSPFLAPPNPRGGMGFARIFLRYSVKGNPHIGINFSSEPFSQVSGLRMMVFTLSAPKIPRNPSWFSTSSKARRETKPEVTVKNTPDTGMKINCFKAKRNTFAIVAGGNTWGRVGQSQRPSPALCRGAEHTDPAAAPRRRGPHSCRGVWQYPSPQGRLRGVRGGPWRAAALPFRHPHCPVRRACCCPREKTRNGHLCLLTRCSALSRLFCGCSLSTAPI